MNARQVTTDDIARAVFVTADEDGEPVPDSQSRRLVAEIEALTGGRKIQGFATATADDGKRFVVAVIGEEAYLLRFDEGVLRVTFLGNLPGLHYEEHLKAIGGMRGFAGEPWVRLQVTHERLPGCLTIEAEDWSVSLLEGLRACFRNWTAQS